MSPTTTASTLVGPYTLGLDFGTNSMRALIVDVRTGLEIGTGVADYRSGAAGILLNPANPDLARQHPRDYLDAIRTGVKLALAQAAGVAGFSPASVIGIGVDTTGSTPIPVDRTGTPLALTPAFADDLDAMAWLWKDHTSHAEAAEITQAAAKSRPEYLRKCGEKYSSEWFWSKILRCALVAPRVFDAAFTWVEFADWVPAVLSGTTDPAQVRRGVCAAGHKCFYHVSWGGYPDEGFLAGLHPGLARVRQTLPAKVYHVGEPAGALSAEWAKELGLPVGIPVAVGAFDAHLGAVGAGATDNTLVKIMGTSTCDIMVAPLTKNLPDVPGLCGIVPESVLPGYFGLEAGQSAVGDMFNWLVGAVRPATADGARYTHESLTREAEQLLPGESGLLALDWHNGNRTVLIDQRLTGLMLGLTLRTSPAEMYRALIEASAFGARVIAERLEEYGVPVKRVVNCGGISARNPMAMQIYADVMNRPIAVSRSLQTCALGSAVAAAVVAGPARGGHSSFDAAMAAMTAVQDKIYQPSPAAVATYDRLFGLYRRLHDAFGVATAHPELYPVMKDLLSIRDSVLAGKSR